MAVTASGVALAEDQDFTKTVVVIGTGTIYSQNSASAREGAISNSLASAVDMVAAELLPLESFIRNFKIINEIIGDQTSEFIQGYKVLAEFPADKKYKVMVEATVSTRLLEARLEEAGLTLGAKPLPKILFLISEQNLADSKPDYWWKKDRSFFQAISERTMADAFRADGFTIIEHADITLNNEIDKVYDKPELNDQEIVDLGTLFQADVVIIGKSFANKSSNVLGTEIRSFKGTVTARAIRTDTGAEMASASQSAVTANSDEITGSRDAFADAGLLAAKELSSQIAAAWQETDKPLSMVSIMLEGTGHLANFVKFRNMLQDMPRVKDVQIMEMKSDQATIMVSFQGTAKELADALILKTFESIGINIYEVSENHLRVELIPG
ncbi:hypothetical protein ACFLYZ_00740 [Thermodesulfobacteriota bacterium]